jgi:hypothetical protein
MLRDEFKKLNMSNFNMSDEEKKKISDQHKTAIKTDLVKKEETKKGLQKPEEKKKTTN